MPRHDDLNWLFSPLEELESFRGLREAAKREGVYAAYGLDDAQRLHMLAGLQRSTGRMLLLVTPTDQAAQRAADDLNALLDGKAALFPAREVSFLRAAAASREMATRRVEALGRALTGELRALVAPIDALIQPLAPKARFASRVFTLESGMRATPEALMKRLVEAGYERCDAAEARGQCALRGGIVDVYPVGRPNPLRVEFFDDEIDSLRDYDALTQRSIDRVSSATIYPASEVILEPEDRARAASRVREALSRALGSGKKPVEVIPELPPWEEFARELDSDEGEDELPELFGGAKADIKTPGTASELERQFLPRVDALETGAPCPCAESMFPLLYENTETIADYLPGALFALDQPERLRERCENRLLEFQEQFKTALERENALPEQANLMLDYDSLLPALTRGFALTLNPFARTMTDIRPKALYHFDGMSATGYAGNLRELTNDLRRWRKDGWRVALLAGGAARGQRLTHALEELREIVPYEERIEVLKPGEPIASPFGLTKGFQYPLLRMVVLSETDIYGVDHRKPRAKFTGGEKLAAFTDLAVGDYVVHEQYGVGQYMGTIRIQADGTYGDYLHIRYQGADKLYVPTDQLDRVQKYIGSEGQPPKLNKLSGNEWQRQKARVQAGIEEIAEDLVKLYAERQSAPGHAFGPDTPWQRQFEDSFPYDETPDQLQAAQEIKRDMQAPRVMDRLLCGDVGYGKTEVALRAIFKAAVGGKQAALLAPTTILVQQHYATMLKRFEGFPVRVDVLSRFKTAAEQKRTLQALARGEIDVLVGTHRLLGKDVRFKDLGLLVVDEEQRFGVKHKEAIKQLKQNVDVLTLSATPIPRTLHMSLVGIRDMSLLRTPPDERYPVQTYVTEYSDALLRDAILREMARGGQVYLLYNRVRSIEKFYVRVKALVPEARVGVGHGQMREHELEDVMLDFYEGRYDVLLCTTIIEAGLDVPTANTLVVIDADRFGLSQLYQLRGRVGRSNRLAYAYLTVRPDKVLSETADKRLAAIREFTEFGSGFRVAMRDMEIRGTGNLFGAQQSGHMAAVGYDLYVKMIEETVRKLRGDVKQGDIVTRMELRVDAYLPAGYVPSDQQRIEVYKRIAAIDRKSAREDVLEEMIDRFGDPARPAINLIDVAHLKGLCSRIGIDAVSIKQGRLHMRFSPKAKLELEKLLAALGKHKNCLTLNAEAPPSLSFAKGQASAEELLRASVPVMEDVVDIVTAEDGEHGAD